MKNDEKAIKNATFGTKRLANDSTPGRSFLSLSLSLSLCVCVCVCVYLSLSLSLTLSL
jgi:hypothetical protein